VFAELAVLASLRVSKLAEEPWSDASGLFLGHKKDFPGDFQGPNLMMRENFGAISFQQSLIPNKLKIICKV
jgi:hypothetical protein